LLRFRGAIITGGKNPPVKECPSNFSLLPQHQKAPPFKAGMNGILLGLSVRGFSLKVRGSPGL